MNQHRHPPPCVNRRQALKFLGAAGLTATSMADVLSNKAFAQQVPEGQVVIGHSQEITVLNPHMLHIEVDDGVHFAIFDPLFKVDSSGNLFPVLAKEVPTVENGGVSADGLHWKMTLRDDVKWHDGRPFTAEDVKFTLELLVDKSFRSWRTTGHEHVRDLTVVSPTEITWRMEKPFAPYFDILAGTFIVPKHAFDGLEDKNTAPFNNAPIGTGAFKFKTRVAGSYIELEANSDYFGEGPYLERIIYRYIPDLTVLYTQFKSGQIDVTGLQAITEDHYDEAKDLPGKQIVVAPRSAIECMALNQSKPWFKELAVRQALYHSIDKASIIEAIYYGLPKATESYLPMQSVWHHPELPRHEYDLDKARALLDAAGWKPGRGGIRQKDGISLSFTNSTTAGNHLREQVQQLLQQSLREIGIEMNIRNLPPAVMWGDYWMMSEYDTCFVGATFITGSDPDASDYFHSSSSGITGGNGQNGFVYANKVVDDLFADGGRAFSPPERRAIYRKVQEILRNDLPLLPLFQYSIVYGHKEGLHGFNPSVNNRIETWNVNQWRWG